MLSASNESAKPENPSFINTPTPIDPKDYLLCQLQQACEAKEVDAKKILTIIQDKEFTVVCPPIEQIKLFSLWINAMRSENTQFRDLLSLLHDDRYCEMTHVPHDLLEAKDLESIVECYRNRTRKMLILKQIMDFELNYQIELTKIREKHTSSDSDVFIRAKLALDQRFALPPLLMLMKWIDKNDFTDHYKFKLQEWAIELGLGHESEKISCYQFLERIKNKFQEQMGHGSQELLRAIELQRVETADSVDDSSHCMIESSPNFSLKQIEREMDHVIREGFGYIFKKAFEMCVSCFELQESINEENFASAILQLMLTMGVNEFSGYLYTRSGHSFMTDNKQSIVKDHRIKINNMLRIGWNDRLLRQVVTTMYAAGFKFYINWFEKITIENLLMLLDLEEERLDVHSLLQSIFWLITNSKEKKELLENLFHGILEMRNPNKCLDAFITYLRGCYNDNLAFIQSVALTALNRSEWSSNQNFKDTIEILIHAGFDPGKELIKEEMEVGPHQIMRKAYQHYRNSFMRETAAGLPTFSHSIVGLVGQYCFFQPLRDTAIAAAISNTSSPRSIDLNDHPIFLLQKTFEEKAFDVKKALTIIEDEGFTTDCPSIKQLELLPTWVSARCSQNSQFLDVLLLLHACKQSKMADVLHDLPRVKDAKSLAECYQSALRKGLILKELFNVAVNDIHKQVRSNLVDVNAVTLYPAVVRLSSDVILKSIGKIDFTHRYKFELPCWWRDVTHFNVPSGKISVYRLLEIMKYILQQQMLPRYREILDAIESQPSEMADHKDDASSLLNEFIQVSSMQSLIKAFEVCVSCFEAEDWQFPVSEKDITSIMVQLMLAIGEKQFNWYLNEISLHQFIFSQDRDKISSTDNMVGLLNNALRIGWNDRLLRQVLTCMRTVGFSTSYLVVEILERLMPMLEIHDLEAYPLLMPKISWLITNTKAEDLLPNTFELLLSERNPGKLLNVFLDHLRHAEVDFKSIKLCDNDNNKIAPITYLGIIAQYEEWGSDEFKAIVEILIEAGFDPSEALLKEEELNEEYRTIIQKTYDKYCNSFMQQVADDLPTLSLDNLKLIGSYTFFQPHQGEATIAAIFPGTFPPALSNTTIIY